MKEVLEKIAAEIRAQGAIPFARFMDLALYCPDYGYYEREKDILGRKGDYFTSVAVGSLFGELLAWQFAEWAVELGINTDWNIVESGAHDGRLAKDILTSLRRHSRKSGAKYWIVEKSSGRKVWQGRELGEFGSQVRWVEKLAAAGGIAGVIFSNELLDAMPVHRLGWDATRREWFEWGVGSEAGRFVWQRMEPANGRPVAEESGKEVLAPVFPEKLLDVLPNGFVWETSLMAEHWYSEASHALRTGKLVTIDYGLTSEELLMPERTNGTLRAYYQHTATNDVLARPGEQDITAHIHFSRLQAIGEAAGLVTESFSTQEQFLTSIAARKWEQERNQPERIREQWRQFQTLTHPEQMGRSFRVLVQSRG